MSWNYKRYRVRWNQKKKKFRKIKRDRQLSRKAHIRWKKNRGKMKQGLRKARIKGKITQRKNKSAGIYHKLQVARKRWKNILKSDNNLEHILSSMILSEQEIMERYAPPEIELDVDDITGIKRELKKIRDDIEMGNVEDEKVKQEYIDSALDILDGLEDEDEDIMPDDYEFLEELLGFIEEYAEEVGLIDSDDEYFDVDDEGNVINYDK